MLQFAAECSIKTGNYPVKHDFPLDEHARLAIVLTLYVEALKERQESYGRSEALPKRNRE
jgi:hypothetical protein